MGYLVRVRGVEIECATLDDVDELIERYGQIGQADSVRNSQRAENSGARANPNAVVGGPGTTDKALLKQLVQSSEHGVSSGMIGGMLSAERKGIPTALSKWADRVGLPQDACIPSRPGGKRGWKLNEGALAAAREILSHGST